MIRLVHDDDVDLVRVNGGRKVVGSVGVMKDKEVKIRYISLTDLPRDWGLITNGPVWMTLYV